MFGLSFGFLRGYSGTHLGKNEELTNIGTQELLLRKTTTSMLYCLGVGYDFTGDLTVRVVAKEKQIVGTVFEEKAIDQRFKSRSVRFGIRYFSRLVTKTIFGPHETSERLQEDWYR